MNIGISKEEFQARQILQDGDTVISDRAYYLIFGGTLLWGFVLNVILINAFQMPLIRALYYSSNPTMSIILGLVLYFVSCFGGIALLRSENVLTSFLGFNLIAVPIGLLLSVAVYGYSTTIVYNAMFMTGAVVLLMIALSMIFPSFFYGIGRMLGLALGCCIIAELICTLIFPHGNIGMFDYIVAAIMCLYLGYDWGRLSVCVRTANNAIDFAASMYLDIINLFLRLLRILGRANRDN